MTFILILMKSLNYLALIWSSLQEEKTSKKYLDQSEQLYKESQRDSNLQMLPKGTVPQLESEFTHTLFYLAQLYKHLGNAEKSASYCHQTLQRQLKYDGDSLNRKEWVVNAQNLAVFYINEGRFRQGIHCLEAAGKMVESVLSADDEEEKASDTVEVEGSRFDDEEEEKRMKADIENSWGVLYTEILKKSYVIMSAADDSDTADSDKSNRNEDEKESLSSGDTKQSKQSGGSSGALMKTQSLIALDERLKIDNSVDLFESLGLKTPPQMELASTYHEAKELFVPGLNHYMNAIAFYVLDGFVTGLVIWCIHVLYWVFIQ